MSMIFLNIRVVVCGNIVVVMVNIIRLLIQYDSTNPQYTDNAFVVVFTLILAAIASISTTKLLIQFNKENHTYPYN